jgi:hypothetical protein
MGRCASKGAPATIGPDSPLSAVSPRRMVLYRLRSVCFCFPGSRHIARRLGRTLVVATLGLIFFAGCGKQEGISHYRVPKQHVLDKENGPDPSEIAQASTVDYRMLAAVLPRDEQAWFFRLLGPAEAVAGESANFQALVKSIHFVGDEGKPEWTLPAGWRQKSGSGMRYASIEIDAPAGPLDLSVTLLPRNEPDLDAYILSNLNRWRGQLGLPPLQLAQLGENVQRVDLEAGQATLVDIVGRKPQDNMSKAPFAGGPMAPPGPAAGAPSGPPPGKTQAPGGRASSSELKYEVPAGWTEAPAGGMRKAAFAIGSGAESAEVTVINLAGAGGALLPNINRWRQQIGLGEITQQDLDRDVKKIELGSQSGDYVELVGPQKAILGVAAHDGKQAWFFKMTGEPAVVSREKQNFETFVRSVRFP